MLKIGPYQLQSNLLLAPMAGITDPTFRKLCRDFGAGLATSEMLTSDIKLWNSKKSLPRLPQADEAEPRSVQIAGAEPEMMARAARLSIAQGAQIIDINMGCPAKKVCNRAAGSALMQQPETAEAIIKAVTHASSVPVMLKIRTGWTVKQRNAVEIAYIAQKHNISALTIHGRSREDAYLGHAEYETIRRVKEAIDIPVIANGDLSHVDDLHFVLNYTNVDGLMIGRAAQGQPWIFQQLYKELNEGKPCFIHFDQKRQIILDHLQQIHAFFGPGYGVRIARKHLGWYLDRLGISPRFKQKIFGANTPEAQVQTLEDALGTSPQRSNERY